MKRLDRELHPFRFGAVVRRVAAKLLVGRQDRKPLACVGDWRQLPGIRFPTDSVKAANARAESVGGPVLFFALGCPDGNDLGVRRRFLNLRYEKGRRVVAQRDRGASLAVVAGPAAKRIAASTGGRSRWESR